MEEGTLLANMQLGFIFRNYSSRIDIWREELFTEEKGMKTPFCAPKLRFWRVFCENPIHQGCTKEVQLGTCSLLE
jgi:hypothetical protein